MSDEDWGLSANAPVFSAMSRKLSPEEQALKDEWVDHLVYAGWSKAERRLYNKCKLEYIAEILKAKQDSTIDDISSALESLDLIKQTSQVHDPQVDALIAEIENLKIQKTRAQNEETQNQNAQ